MNLLVFSDAHGNSSKMKTAVARQLMLPFGERPDYILFLGDGIGAFDELDAFELLGASLLAVKGNCDSIGASDIPELRIPTFANYRTVMTHGHRFSVKSGLEELVSFGVQNRADLVLFGHTHRPVCHTFDAGEQVYGVSPERPLVLFNPGSIGYEGSFGTVKLSRNGIFCSHGWV